MKYILVSVTVTPTVRFTIKARCAVNLTPAINFFEILNRFKFLQQTLQLGIIFIHIPQQAYINISQKKRKKKPKAYLFIIIILSLVRGCHQVIGLRFFLF